MGLLGLCLAGLLAAIMSSVDSGLCASSSLLTFDFIMKGKKGKLDDTTQLRLGRWIILVLLIFAILWAPYIEQFPGLFDYLMLLWSLLAPPIFVCVMCGLFYPPANAKGAVATLVVGIMLGALGFLVLRDTAINEWLHRCFPAYFGSDFRISEHLHWYFRNRFNIGFMITLLCLAVMLVVSHLTGQTEADKEKARAIVRARDDTEDHMTLREKILYRGVLLLLAALWLATVMLFSPLGIAN